MKSKESHISKFTSIPINFVGEWAIITNIYGKMLTYNLPSYNLMYAKLTYQRYITQMLNTNKYEIFLDVGAYTGLFSQVAANHCKQVYSYEAHPIYYGILLYNMRFYKNVKCIHKHISNETIVPKIHSTDPMCMITSKLDVLEEYNIKTTTLDKEFIQFRDIKTLIKLDIEGYELNALEGSKELLKHKNIDWIMDVHLANSISLEDVKAYFKNRKIELIGFKVLKVT